MARPVEPMPESSPRPVPPIGVRISTDLDFRVTEKTEEKYDSEEPAIRSRNANRTEQFAVQAG